MEAINRLRDEHKLDTLKNSRSFDDSTDILVPPGEMPAIEKFAMARNLTYYIKPNYGRSFENVVERLPRRRRYRSFSIYQYHSHNSILRNIEMLAYKHPNIMELQTLGTSYEGRYMKLVKLSLNPYAHNPIIFVDAGIHAREWVAPAMAMYLIHKLVSCSVSQYELSGLDWYILPVVNPDGYQFTRSSKSNRLWRKTRSKSHSSDCYGVDGNRNYGYNWGVSGVSKDPCDDQIYPGPHPFSEIETKMVRNVMHEYRKRIKLYVSLHSYGNYLVYPWGYTGAFLPKKWKKLDSLARAVSNSVQRAGGQPFKVMSAGKWYAAAGGSDDYAFGGVGIPYAYTMELTNGYEFSFPKKLLRIVLPQYYEGFKTFARHVKQKFRKHGASYSKEAYRYDC